MPAGRALGTSLLAGAIGITALMLVWLMVSGARGGGIVLGLLLVLVLAGPLGAAGLYILGRQPVEERQAAEFASRQRIVEADR
ncbi:MAG: hypothetical protein M3336_01900, partial [Chloroflexota bacterium]|nr:hypothetical protein [Chloroflexota bacterium]